MPKCEFEKKFFADVWHVALQLTITHHWRHLAVIF